MDINTLNVDSWFGRAQILEGYSRHTEDGSYSEREGIWTPIAWSTSRGSGNSACSIPNCARGRLDRLRPLSHQAIKLLGRLRVVARDSHLACTAEFQGTRGRRWAYAAAQGGPQNKTRSGKLFQGSRTIRRAHVVVVKLSPVTRRPSLAVHTEYAHGRHPGECRFVVSNPLASRCRVSVCSLFVVRVIRAGPQVSRALLTVIPRRRASADASGAPAFRTSLQLRSFRHIDRSGL